MPAPGLRPHFNYNTLFHRPSCNQQCARAAAILRHRILSFSIIATLSNVVGLPTARLACAQVIWPAPAKGSYTERRVVQRAIKALCIVYYLEATDCSLGTRPLDHTSRDPYGNGPSIHQRL